jgi:hypothetical protein
MAMRFSNRLSKGGVLDSDSSKNTLANSFYTKELSKFDSNIIFQVLER